MEAEMQTIGMIFATQLVPKLSRHEALQLLFTLKEVASKDPMGTTIADYVAPKAAMDDDDLARVVVKAMAGLCGSVMEAHREKVAELSERITKLEDKRRPDLGMDSPQELKVWKSNNTTGLPMLGRSALEMPK
jgi:hypothetical protein